MAFLGAQDVNSRSLDHEQARGRDENNDRQQLQNCDPNNNNLAPKRAQSSQSQKTADQLASQRDSTNKNNKNSQPGHKEARSSLSDLGKSEKKSQLSSSTRTPAGGTFLTSGVRSGRGLLEALLGERGKSWLEHKTVILDIQNGDRAQRREKQQQQQQQVAQDRPPNEFAEEELHDEKLQQSEEDEKVATDSKKRAYQRRPSPIILTNRQTRASALRAGGHEGIDLRVPTFGSVPQKVARLPYYSYQGQAKNVQLSRSSDRHTNRNGRQSVTSFQTTRSSSTYTSSSESSSSSSHRTSGEFRVAETPTPTPPPPPPPTTTTTTTTTTSQAKATLRKYSNISNLFPVKKTISTEACLRRQIVDTTSGATEQKGSSGSSRDRQQQAQNRDQMHRRRGSFAVSTPALSGNQAAGQQQQLPLSADMNVGGGGGGGSQQITGRTRSSQSIGYAPQPGYPNVLSSRQQAGGKKTPNVGASAAAASGQQQSRPRPLSSTGNYPTRSPTIGSGGGGAMRASSAAGARGAPGPLRFYAPYGPPLVDPDCPVHGDELTGQPVRQRSSTMDRQRPGATRVSSYGTTARPAGPMRRPQQQHQHQQQQQQHQQLEHSVSQPELLYEGAEDEMPASSAYVDEFETDNYQPIEAADTEQHQYYDRQAGSEQPSKTMPIYRSPSIYSPISPNVAGQNPLRSSQRPGSKQASAYYNSSSRFSLYHPTHDGLQSSLAPTSEQLRRILGYKPPPPGTKPVHLHPQWAYSRPFIHLQPANLITRRRRSSTSPQPLGGSGQLYDEDELLGGAADQYSDIDLDSGGPRFWPFNRLQDTQAIRAVDFHPNGEVYAVGSNSRALRICAYPAEHELRHFNPLQSIDDDALLDGEEDVAARLASNVKSPRVLFKFLQVHRGSIYCVAFNPGGHLLATGSNDQTVHLVKYNSITHNPDGDEFRLTMHNGTIRDLCFIDDSFGSGSSLLLSAGGGDNKIYVTDCDTVTPYQSMAGHTQMVMALNHCGGAQFVSGSYDKTIRFWDLRTRACTAIVSAPPAGGGGGAGAPISSLRVDPSGRLLASGHTDSTCMLYDIRGGKIIQTFRPHDDEIRAISFSPKSYYLLTGSYDGRLMVSDLQGDLTRTLPSACVAECHDKIVQAKWHPSDFTFVSTSADKSATLWALPGELV